MELQDYIEEIEPLLSRNNGRHVISCVCEFSKLLGDVMPNSGKEGIRVAESYLLGSSTGSDLVNARVAIWEDHDSNFQGKPEGAALRAIICGLFFPIENDEYYDTLTYAVDFCKSASSSIKDEDFKRIIEYEFRT